MHVYTIIIYYHPIEMSKKIMLYSTKKYMSYAVLLSISVFSVDV